MRKDPYEKRRVIIKAVILFLLILFFVGLLCYMQYKKEQARKKYEAQIETEKQTEGNETGKKESKDKEQPEKEPGEGDSVPGKNGDSSGDAWDWNLGGGAQDTGIRITNLAEYASPAMGTNARLLEQSLAGWVTEKKNTAKRGTIIHVMVPQSDPQSVHYYVRMEDSAGTLVLLSYHPRENVVTASDCSYTEEEILAEAWEGNAPCDRDVSPEADALHQQPESGQGIQPDLAGMEPGGE